MSNDKDLTEYLWPIVCEMVKTAIENNQNLIVEYCTVDRVLQDNALYLELAVKHKVNYLLIKDRYEIDL